MWYAMTLEEKIRRALTRPINPRGKDIEWKHPYLIFLAENGIIAASEEDEQEQIEKLNAIVRSLD